MLPGLQSRHHPVRNQHVHVRVSRRHNRPRAEDRPVRHQRNAHAHAVDLVRPVVEIKAVCGVDVDQVRVLKRCCRRPQARRLVVAGGDEVGDTGACRDAGCLLQEADDHVRRRTHRVEDVARVDHEVHILLQDGVNRPPVSFLYVYLALVAVGLGAELRKPGVSQVRIRDMGYADYSCGASSPLL